MAFNIALSGCDLGKTGQDIPPERQSNFDLIVNRE
jgi:hypothetical protein